jgi:RNA polymerase sigma factor (sigma-70 family)
VSTPVEDLLRRLAPQVLGSLVRRIGDFDDAEDALQEALLAAATQWPAEGLPDNPRGWLLQVAQRRGTDAIRSELARRHRETMLFHATLAPAVADRDDTLELFFRCANPALSPAAAIALTLRALGGLTTAEIARAFMVPEPTMAQRITRAKQRLAALDRPFAPPAGTEGRDRLAAVLHVLYLMFNEGYATSAGAQVHRVELSGEAIRLARLLRRLVPDSTEAAGLLALMLLTDARRPARTGPHGELVGLAEQDRTQWDRGLITEGVALAADTLAHGLVGPYQLQAAIAVVHAQASRAEDTDWGQILALYRLLERMSPNPVVTLNRAVATAMVHGPQAGLDLLTGLDDQLAGSHRLDAVRGHLYEMAGDGDRAAAHYTRAARRTTSEPEQHYLTIRAARLRGGR